MFSHCSAVISWVPHWIFSCRSTWHLSKGAAAGGTFGCWGWCFCTGSIQWGWAATSQTKTRNTTTQNRLWKSSIMVLRTTHWPKLQQQHLWLRHRLYTWLIVRRLPRSLPLVVRSQLCGSPAELISWVLTGWAYCLLICLKRSHYVTVESKLSGVFWFFFF